MYFDVNLEREINCIFHTHFEDLKTLIISFFLYFKFSYFERKTHIKMESAINSLLACSFCLILDDLIASSVSFIHWLSIHFLLVFY